MLASAGNGIRITGLVLVVEEPREFSGTSKTGRPYAFTVRELQMFTGNKAVTCKQMADANTPFPDIKIGDVRTFKIKTVRMNGTEPIFDLELSE